MKELKSLNKREIAGHIPPLSDLERQRKRRGKRLCAKVEARLLMAPDILVESTSPSFSCTMADLKGFVPFLNVFFGVPILTKKQTLRYL